MRLANRVNKLESEAGANGRQHLIAVRGNWDRDLALEHYGRDRIGPYDRVTFIVWNMSDESQPPDYPAGYFDPGGRWAKLCAERGIPHRDHPSSQQDA